MKNVISKTITGLIFQSQRALPGVRANLNALGYSTAQGEIFDLRVSDLITARDVHAASLVTLGVARTAHAAVMKSARTVVMTGRDALKPFLGREHSSAWVEASFVNNLAVAEDTAGVLRHVQGLIVYLAAHPEQENPVLNITADRFETVETDLMTAIANLDLAKSNTINLAKDRDAKAKLVRLELRMLLSKLRVMFDPFAAMWELVGFKRPGFVSVPEVPENVTAVLVKPDAAAVKWERPPRAESYRIYAKVVGVDQEFALIATRENLDFVMENLTPNATTELAVSAVNSGGESALSEVMRIVMTSGKLEGAGTSQEPAVFIPV